MYTRQTQKLIYWLISCYANYINGNAPNITPSAFSIYQAKKKLKSVYINSLDYEPPNDALSSFLLLLADYVKDDKDYKLLCDQFVKSIKDYLWQQEEFSLALDFMGQEEANAFLNWMLEVFIEYEIPIREEIIALLDEEQERKFIFICLLKKKCCICGKEITGPHHHDHVGTSGYEHDTGLDKRIAPLCGEHHAEIHAIGKFEFQKRYQTYGTILCKPEEIEKLKEIYRHHFKGMKEVRDEVANHQK